MAVTHKAISTVSLTTTASQINFTSIPQTYNDLLLKISARNDDTSGAGNLLIVLNSSSSSFSNIYSQANGSNWASGSIARMIGDMNSDAETSNVFNNIEVYITDYATSSRPKIFSSTSAQENNSTAYIMMTANLWSNNNAITSITLENRTAGKLFKAYTTATLYGISNS